MGRDLDWALTLLALGLCSLLESQVYLETVPEPLSRPPAPAKPLRLPRLWRSLSTGVEVSLSGLNMKATQGPGELSPASVPPPL